MDHEVIPCSPKTCDWLSNLSRDTLQFLSRRKCQSNLDDRGPQKAYIQAYTNHRHDPTCLYGDRGRIGYFAATKSADHGKEIPFEYFKSFFIFFIFGLVWKMLF